MNGEENREAISLKPFSRLVRHVYYNFLFRTHGYDGTHHLVKCM